MPEVIFLTRVLTHYRVPFHVEVRRRLALAGVHYRLIYGSPTRAEALKGDLATLSWAEFSPTRYIGKSELAWQAVPPGPHPQLIIVGQENKLLLNYALQMFRHFSGTQVAYFGHGKNFQAANNNSIAEQFKRLWVKHVDWWFAYTERSAQIVTDTGFPRSRVTVFNNAVDTASMRQQLESISESDKRKFLVENDLSENVGLYIGGLYHEKRIPFLVDAARRIREQVPDFQLVVGGGGPEEATLRAAAVAHPWIRPLGPIFDRDKAMIASISKAYLMPGLVGLGILDSFAYRVPLVTTSFPFHSPEIDYLKNGVNGVIVDPHTDLDAYVEAVVSVIKNDEKREALIDGMDEGYRLYSVSNMATLFSEGVLLALSLGKHS